MRVGSPFSFYYPETVFVIFRGIIKGASNLPVAGGQVQTICDAPNRRGVTWNKDGVIVFAPDTNVGLHRVSASGGTPTQISKLDRNRGEDGHRWPMFLPDGTHYLYLAANFTGRKGVNAIFAGSLDSDEKRFIMEASANAIFTAPGYLLFYRHKALLAQPFDLKRFALTGQPTTVLTDIQYLPQVRRALFAPITARSLPRQAAHLPYLNPSGSTVKARQKEWWVLPMCMATCSWLRTENLWPSPS